MKFIFLGCFVALSVSAVITWRLRPEMKHTLPVLYWVTDDNPARREQIAAFRKWVAEYHPNQQFELYVDVANDDPTKRVIEAVSGDGDDLIDSYSGSEMRYFQQLGILQDVREDALRMGFGPAQTWPAIRADIMTPLPRGGEGQFGFPANVTAQLYFVNLEALSRYGMAPPPPSSWSMQEFERIGKEFVAKANLDQRRRKFFFADSIPIDVIRRSWGGAIFNETQTRCTLDNWQSVAAMKLQYKWTYVDHLLPTESEAAAEATPGSYGGEGPQLFLRGNFAMLWSGRYMLDAFRKFDDARRERGEQPLPMATVEAPCDGFRNTQIGSRATAVYAGGKHKELAKLFLEFLASEDYSMEIVRDADGLPPNPEYCKSEAFLRPMDHPEDTRLNGPFARAANDLAVAGSFSPFVLGTIVETEEKAAIAAYMDGVTATAEEAAQKAARHINDEIQRTLDEQPELRALYDQRVETQKKIDALKAAGKKIPLEWINDPFYHRYYQAQGMTE